MPRRSRTRVRVFPALSVLVVGLILVAWPASPAEAHDDLLETSPADGSTVETVPREVVLRFTGDLLDFSQDVIVTTPDGEQLTGLDVSVEGAQAVAVLPDGLGPGAYTVAWRVVSNDGHPVQGKFGFVVAGGPVATASPSPGVPAPTGTATPGVDGPAADSSSAALAWIGGAAGLAIAAVAGAYALRRHRS